ncbi:polysaccharide biosynthesis/export family protein [Ferrimonas balearica]|uniref:polysaccharide biosynthesis/export family protein n=1 Tax=Ferrimonas balearica TaxID=44012 RepID=UPI001C97604F|nr:polysaccharide biosynthesis/export family protein [Ferrimonas balearica]MBY5981228.1 polysaccharide export protein [Ferrimonas balearica]
MAKKTNGSLKAGLLMVGIRKIIILLLCFGLIACSTLPAFGPSSDSFDAYREGKPGISLVELTPEKILILQQEKLTQSLAEKVPGAQQRLATSPPLEVGEIFRVDVWESVDNGLFSSGNNRRSQFDVTVDEEGNIFFPFVGAIPVAGLSTTQARDVIARALDGLAVDPQVQISREDQESNLVTVTGDVNAPARLPVPVTGLRILDALANAGGATSATYDANLSLIRRDEIYSARLSEVLRRPKSNIYLQPRDSLLVEHSPRTFSVFGAFQEQNKHQMDENDYTLSHALAQAGGLDDRKASARDIFLFRFESAERLQELNVELPSAQFSKGWPTIYHLDLEQPQAFFLASSVPMEDNDIVYIATASASEFRKFVEHILAPVLIAEDAVKTLSFD